ncbi:MAG: lamin tail domain-containing protein, partial [Cyanobacteria bacterium J06632_3]
GEEKENEWISIINLSGESVNLEGWKLSDMRRKPLVISDVLPAENLLLQPGQAIRIQPVAPVLLSNRSGVITLYEKPNAPNESGRRIDRVHYTREQAKKEGNPIIFNNRWEQTR